MLIVSLLNDQLLGEFTWDGQGPHTIEADVPAGVLREGANTATLILPGVKDVTADITFLNWIELNYPRAFVAQDDRLVFDSPGGRHQLSGFSGPIDVFDVTQPDRITRTRLNADAIFAGEAGHRYWAVGPQGYRSGRVEAAQLTPDLRAANNAAPYLAIGPIDLLEPLQPLLEWRAAQGLKTMAVPVQAIYDQFGDGPRRSGSDSIVLAVRRAALDGEAAVCAAGGRCELRYAELHDAAGRPTACRRFWCRRCLAARRPAMWASRSWTTTRSPMSRSGACRRATRIRCACLWQKTIAYEKNAPAGEWRSRVLAVADGQEAVVP